MSIDPKSTHYDAGGIEVLEVIKAKLTPEQLQGYYLGNAIKYSLRLNHKGTSIRDAEKLEFYSRFLNSLLQESKQNINTATQIMATAANAAQD